MSIFLVVVSKHLIRVVLIHDKVFSTNPEKENKSATYDELCAQIKPPQKLINKLVRNTLECAHRLFSLR